ncbi:magnesium-translocating P-type ATPase [Burkholderia diffusa]|uniref:magnesium-translocating P-type ATPase n=1 Tax=Burkholderia diffusa TaxID=488732 RepID=UPI001FC7F783|nr:magnesium-translocating P-type ATPase [Burkholderia diffusa]
MNFDFAGLMTGSGGSTRRSRAKPEFDRDSALAASRIREISRLEIEHVYERLETGPAGLSEAEAAQRLITHGRNTVAQHAGDGVLHHLTRQVRSPLNLMLLSLALVSVFLGDARAAIVITVMVVLSIGLSFVQEYRSNQAAAKLRAMVRTTATVLRRPKLASATIETTGADHGSHLQNNRKEEAIGDLVPGDVITLSAGDMVPADIRLVAAKDLFINEAALTGEALPAEKFAHVNAQDIADPLDLPNICFMGTNIVSGAGTGVVILTGGETFFGHVANTIARQRDLTSFDKGVNRFVWLMICVIAVMVPLVFLINGLTKSNWIEALFFAVAVAVGLTPEMLPMIVTVNLAKGALAMSRKKVIIKRLNAIQNFGAMDVLCTDKTGTLTQDKVILKRHLDIHGEDSDKVLHFAYLNSYYQSGLHNLLDAAVLKHGDVHEALNVETEFEKVDEVPFDFERRRMSVIVERADKTHLLICKGAVEEIFKVSSSYEVAGERGKLDQSHYVTAKDETDRLNGDGFRVVAVAYKDINPPKPAYGVEDETDLTLLGYIAFLDPPKDSAAAAIATLKADGVRVKVLTGDNDIVTRKICNEVRLPADRILLGAEIEGMTADALADAVEAVDIFAKLSPAQKASVIEALRRKGHVVGYLGDGINDSPALKAADVGISVDTAVDIAKETADIILLEKSLGVLGEGIIEGRRVFGNITKYIKMGASSNFGNMFSVLGASIFLPFLPMAPIQVLTNNLLYDFSQTTIPTDNVDADYLKVPRRWDIGNILKFMLFIGPISSIFDYATYFAMIFIFNAWRDPSLFQTGWFVESLLSQTLIIHVIRTARVPFIESRASPALIATSLIICALGIILPFIGIGAVLGFKPLPDFYWIVLGVILAGYLCLTHLTKGWLIRRFGMS